jgi:hypothetical protein
LRKHVTRISDHGEAGGADDGDTALEELAPA